MSKEPSTFVLSTPWFYRAQTTEEFCDQYIGLTKEPSLSFK
jgi:hypothetical protein